MSFLQAYKFRFLTAIRLALMIGPRQIALSWDNHTLAEIFEGKASPLEAAAFLAVQNMPRLKRRKTIDKKLRQLIQSGRIRKGVLAN